VLLNEGGQTVSLGRGSGEGGRSNAYPIADGDDGGGKFVCTMTLNVSGEGKEGGERSSLLAPCPKRVTHAPQDTGADEREGKNFGAYSNGVGENKEGNSQKRTYHEIPRQWQCE